MLKDIHRPKVENLAIAIVPPEDPTQELWEVFVLNLEEEPIHSVLIVSKGYGELDGEQRRTATLRYFFEEIPALTVLKVEPIQPAVFELANEYWVSYSFHNELYDKKYVFVRGSIADPYFTLIPFLNRRGVMIR
ncbi:MAG: hypothetical protein D6772_06285 [Bacteroidetes bacterium]|nr:MAG: hypothetical protein D6772_06285 [Bacteroidota bacterium]